MLLQQKHILYTIFSLSILFTHQFLHALDSDPRSTRQVILEIDDCCIASSTCDATPITAPMIITTTGFYCLADDIMGTVTIDSADVVLDLNNHVIHSGGNGVVVTSTQENVIIKNGTVKDTSQEGILVNLDCVKIEILDMELIRCGADGATNQFAIHFLGDAAAIIGIKNCRVERTVISNCPSGIKLEHTDNCCIQDCKVLSLANSNELVGYLAEQSLNTLFKNCLAKELVGGMNVIGFHIMATSDNTILQNCHSIDQTTNFGPDSIGFRVFESNHVVFEQCVNSDNSVTGGPFPVPSAIGFEIVSLFSNMTTDCVLKDCLALNITTIPNGAQSIGFSTAEPMRNCTFDHCITSSVVALGSPSSAFGFRLLSPFSKIKHCQALNTFANVSTGGSTGILLPACSIAKHCEVINCQGLAASTIGISAVRDNSIVDFCTVCNNSGDGFSVGGFSSCVLHSTAKDCSTGFLLGGTNGIVGECLAADCTTGFDDTGGTTSKIFSNFAADNGTNYSGVGAPNTVVVYGGASTVLGANISA